MRTYVLLLVHVWMLLVIGTTFCLEADSATTSQSQKPGSVEKHAQTTASEKQQIPQATGGTAEKKTGAAPAQKAIPQTVQEDKTTQTVAANESAAQQSQAQAAPSSPSTAQQPSAPTQPLAQQPVPQSGQEEKTTQTVAAKGSTAQQPQPQVTPTSQPAAQQPSAPKQPPTPKAVPQPAQEDKTTQTAAAKEVTAQQPQAQTVPTAQPAGQQPQALKQSQVQQAVPPTKQEKKGAAEQKPKPKEEPARKEEKPEPEKNKPEKSKETEAKKQEPKEEPKKEKPQSAVIEDALDTIDIYEGGNWLFKRQTLEQMMDSIEEINDLFTKVIEARFDYLVQRNQANREFDAFAQSIGYELGDLDRLINMLLEHLAREREQEGDLSESEREVLNRLQEQQEEFKQVQQAAQKVIARDQKINEAIMAIEQQIEVARGYQNQAWRNFQAVKGVWSEDRARELFQKTELIVQNIRQLYQTWLKGDLQRYVNELIQSSRSDMERIKTKMDQLQEQGFDVKEEVERIENRENQEEHDELAELRERLREEEEAVAKKPKPSFFMRTWRTVKAPFSWAWSSVRSLFGKKEIQEEPGTE